MSVPTVDPVSRTRPKGERLITPAEFDRMDNKGFELIDGRLVEKPAMGLDSDAAQINFILMVGNYVKLHRLGRCFSPEGGFECFPDRPNTVRKPDLSFVAKGRFPNDKPPIAWGKIAPDLIAEILSPNDRKKEVSEKVAMFLAAGVRLVWVIDPKLRKVFVHRSDGTTTEIPTDGTLDGEDVLPGFTCRIAELFE
jgi:Uma2 family endonuclease